MGEEELQECLNLLLARLQETWVHIAKQLLLGEGRQHIDAPNAALYHRLELAYR